MLKILNNIMRLQSYRNNYPLFGRFFFACSPTLRTGLFFILFRTTDSFQSTLICPTFHSIPNASLNILDQLPNNVPSPSLFKNFSHFDRWFYNILYINGSKTYNNSTYIAVAVYSLQLQAEFMYKLSSYISIFSAEAFAIYNVILDTLDLHLTFTTIVTDTRSVLETIRDFHNCTNNYLRFVRVACCKLI